MTNEELNTALYEKMFAEQETYRAWLLSQPPEEILNHAYEYTVREDILMSLEYHDLPDAQAKALLNRPFPLPKCRNIKRKTKRSDNSSGPDGVSSRPFYIAGLSQAVNSWLWKGGFLCHIFPRRSLQKQRKWTC